MIFKRKISWVTGAHLGPTACTTLVQVRTQKWNLVSVIYFYHSPTYLLKNNFNTHHIIYTYKWKKKERYVMVQAHALLFKNKRIQTIKKKKRRDYIVLLLLGILIRSFLHMPKVDFHFQLRNRPPLALGLPQTSSSIPILVLDQLTSFFFLESQGTKHEQTKQLLFIVSPNLKGKYHTTWCSFDLILTFDPIFTRDVL